MRRARARVGLPARPVRKPRRAAGELSLGRAARLLAESFLPGPVRGELGGCWRRRSGRISRSGSAWRCRRGWPGCRGRRCPARMAAARWRCTRWSACTARRTRQRPGVLPGPLRIVVAIAAPDTGGGAVLDYERELRNVLAAVRAARQDAADVRVVPFATPAAIRAELDRGPAHVLHISGHGSPGLLYLENEDGSARPVTAEEFLDQAIPPGRMPPVVTLSACYTDAAASAGRRLVRGPAVRSAGRRR